MLEDALEGGLEDVLEGKAPKPGARSQVFGVAFDRHGMKDPASGL
jgi:hypothetical protein